MENDLIQSDTRHTALDMWVPDLGLALRVRPGMYDGEIRGRFLAPRDFSLPAHLAGVTAHARPAQRSVPSL
eukprot:2022625-Prymnesium_polylepis.1